MPRVNSPRTLIALLDLAEGSDEGLEMVRLVLNHTAADAYRDVGEPFGDDAVERWLTELLKPHAWLQNPHWTRALESRLATLGQPRDDWRNN